PGLCAIFRWENPGSEDCRAKSPCTPREVALQSAIHRWLELVEAKTMVRFPFVWSCFGLAVSFLFLLPSLAADPPTNQLLLRLDPPALSSDKSVRYDYDIGYVRLQREGHKPKVWAQAGVPLQMNPGADLMLLHPDGREEVLVPGGKGSVTDPMVSFDGQWVYY